MDLVGAALPHPGVRRTVPAASSNTATRSTPPSTTACPKA